MSTPTQANEYTDQAIAIADLENEYAIPVNEYVDPEIAIADLENEYKVSANAATMISATKTDVPYAVALSFVKK